MEVYATIFMIFVSHVLSSFSSPQRDGRHIPYPKIRKIPIVHFQNHNNDEENQQDIALEYVLPLTAGLLRDKNGDSDMNVQYDSDKILKTKLSDLKFRRGIRNLIHKNDFVSIPESNPLLHRKKKFSFTNNFLNLFPGIISHKHSSTIRPFHYLSTNNEAYITKSGKSKNKISSAAYSSTEAWDNKAKIKYTTIRPWNQHCQSSKSTENLKDNNTESSTTCPTTVDVDLCIMTGSWNSTKLNTTNNKCDEEIASDNQWLFNAGTPITPNHTNSTDKCFTQSTFCGYKLRSSCLNKNINKYLDNFHMKRRRTKRRNYFQAPESGELGILQTTASKVSIDALEKNKLFPLYINFNNKNLMFRVSKLNKRSLNAISNENKDNIVGFFSFNACNKDRNITRGIPPCQKACYYNLKKLVNARTIKPPGYFKKQPSLLLCCHDEANKPTSSKSTTSRSNRSDLDDLDATTDITTVTDSTPSDIVDTSNRSSEMTTDSKISTPPLFRMLVQLRNMPSKKGSSPSRKPEDEFYLKLLVRDKKDLTDSNDVKLKSELENKNFGNNPIETAKRRKPKKHHPWNASKYCSTCSVGKKKETCCTDDTSKSSKLPWDFSCCYPSGNATDKRHKTTSSRSKSTSRSDKSTKSNGSEESSKGNEIASGGTEAISSAVETTSTHVRTTASTRKTTTIRPKAFYKVTKAKRSTFPYVTKVSSGEHTVENKLSPTPFTSIQDILKLRASESNKQFGESRNFLDKDENIRDELSVPVLEKYNQNENLGLVSPPKHVKPRSIFREFLPSLLWKTTLPPLLHNWNIFDDKLNPAFTPADIRNLFTNESPLLNMNVNKRIAKTCPSCLKKRKELVFETTFDGKKANCIIDDNNLFYEEDTGGDDSNRNEQSTEQCDGKYVSYLLKYPKESLIKNSSPLSRELHSTKKDLTILHSDDSPPKYYIEVPESLASAIDLDDKDRAKILATTLLKENPDTRLQSQKQLKRGNRKKQVVLRLQPFGINGHNIYLPMTGADNSLSSKAAIYIRNTDSGDYLDDGLNPSSSKPAIRGYIGKNDSVLPFALVPAFLAIHPSNLTGSVTTETVDPLVATQEDQKSDLNVTAKYSLTKDEEVALSLLLNNLSIEKKPVKISKQVKAVSLHHPSTKIPSKSSVLPKKLSRKSTSVRPSFAPDKPMYIILIKDTSNDPLREDFDFLHDEVRSSTLGQKIALSLDNWGEFLH